MPKVCRLTDISETITPDVHGCPACPHPCAGPATAASGNVWIQGKQALRKGDTGVHAACCGSNTWKVIEASAQVYVNGMPLVRVGDRTQHCGALGKMTTGAAIVVDGSPMTDIHHPTTDIPDLKLKIKSLAKNILKDPAPEPVAPEAPAAPSPAPVSAPSVPTSVPSSAPFTPSTPIAGGAPFEDLPELKSIVQTISKPILR